MTKLASNAMSDEYTNARVSSPEFFDPTNCRHCKRTLCICVTYNGSEPDDYDCEAHDHDCEAHDHPAVLVDFWTSDLTVATCRCRKRIYA